MNNLHKHYTKLAKHEIKTNKALKFELKDLSYHFKHDKWPLDYDYVYELAQVSYKAVFNKIMELKGYKMSYCSKRLCFIITKAKT